MMPKFFSHTEDSAASAAFFVLGSLRGDEKTAFEQHVQEGCAVCEQELDELANVMENLSLATTPAEPSETVRRRLLDSLAAEPQKSGAGPELLPKATKGILLQQSGLLIARSADMCWKPVAPGISCKILFADQERMYTTCLIRAEAGARYPRHCHAGVEELLVLEGDLHVHGVVMRAGDYCRAEPGSFHEETFTEGGCVLLQLNSQFDEIEE